MLIAKFFDNHDIFITGGSGFVGKALIEKLLRSCPGLGRIYVLLRGKKGKDAHERLRDILNTSLFNRVRVEQPQSLKKVYAIAGDCTELGLGISATDLQQLRNVNFIFHSAASVRFDDALRDAVLMNVRGTCELIKIAETMPHLKVFMHVSTTYCNPEYHIVEEKLYPPYADWRTTLKLAETYSTETLNILNLKYSSFQPNTYTFTKSLAEQVINDHKDKLPMIIFRPSIVISSINEPIAGWVDNFNGPVGMLVACGIGIMRTNYGDPDVVSDFVPVDVVVRSMLAASYKKVLESQNDKELVIYNCATSNICSITMGQVIEIGKRCIKKNPFEKTLWVPGGGITRCYVWNLIRFMVLHVLMALLVDSVLWAMNMKPFLLRLQRRIYGANLALHYFLTTSWIFQTDKFVTLDTVVPKEEIDKFAFLQYANPDLETVIQSGIRGAKEFLLKESPISSKQAKMRMRIYEAIHFFIQLLGVLLIVRFVVGYCYRNYFFSTL